MESRKFYAVEVVLGTIGSVLAVMLPTYQIAIILLTSTAMVLVLLLWPDTRDEGRIQRIKNLPWFHIWVAAAVLFAAIPTGLVKHQEWEFNRTTKDKLAFQDVRIRKMLSADGSVSAIKLGCKFKNLATFPIQFDIQGIHTSFAGNYPPKKGYETTKLTIPVNGSGWFDDHIIELSSLSKKNELMEGSIYMRLKYGRPEKLDQELEVRKRVFVKFNTRGDVQATEWHDI